MDTGAMIVTRSNLVFCRLVDDPNPAVLEQLGQAIDSHDTPVIVVIYVGAGARLPSSQTRRHAIALLTTRAGQIAAWIVILEGTGFVRSALRSVANTIRLVARPPFPLSVVDTREAALAWLSKNTTADVGALEIPWPDDPAGTG